jgi:hypothetical protein
VMMSDKGGARLHRAPGLFMLATSENPYFETVRKGVQATPRS